MLVFDHIPEKNPLASKHLGLTLTKYPSNGRRNTEVDRLKGLTQERYERQGKL